MCCWTIFLLSWVFLYLCVLFLFSLWSDSNLNRYEVHPTRTASEAIGPEFHTHLRVNTFHNMMDSSCGEIPSEQPVSSLLCKAKLGDAVCVCSCWTSAVTPWVIWSSGWICPPWLQKTQSSWLSLTSLRTTWVILPRWHWLLFQIIFLDGFNLPHRPQGWTAACRVIWHSWKPDSETFAPFIKKTWCRMTYWWVPCWRSSYLTLRSITFNNAARLFRTVAGHGALRLSARSSSF